MVQADQEEPFYHDVFEGNTAELRTVGNPPLRNKGRNWMILFGCGSTCFVRCANDSSPFRAAISTMARNSAENIRRGRRIIMLHGVWRLHKRKRIGNTP